MKRRDKIKDAFRRGTPIDQAIDAAVLDALEQHKRAGQPIAEWRDGRVIWVAPEDIELPGKRKRTFRNGTSPSRRVA